MSSKVHDHVTFGVGGFRPTDVDTTVDVSELTAAATLGFVGILGVEWTTRSWRPVVELQLGADVTSVYETTAFIESDVVRRIDLELSVGAHF